MKFISNHTDINCDTLLEGYFWPTNKSDGVLFPWHQDHEPYYMNELNYNYLNFYIMLQKENPTQSNLALVPFDHLPANIRQLVERRGGTQYGSGENIKERIKALGPFHPSLEIMDKYDFVMRDSMTGRVSPLAVNFETVKVVPNLDVGDLLIMRGDMIHRTADNLCERLALSLRCVKRDESVISINKVMALTASLERQPINTHKAKVMLLNKQWIDLLSIMSASNQSTMNYADHPSVWENGDWAALSFFQKCKFFLWTFYYKYTLKALSSGKGTLFYWHVH